MGCDLSPSGQAFAERDIPEDGGRIAHDATFGVFTPDDQAVATILAHPWALGGGMAGLKTAAVSGVGTIPEYRRLGLLRAHMRMLFQDCKEKGQVDIGFVDGDGGSCTVRRQSPTPDLAEVLRPLYDGFIEGRACCFGYDEGGDHTSAHRVFMSRGRGNSQFPTRIQYCAVA